MFWAWQTVAHVILLQVALAFYVLVWPVLRKGAFSIARILSKWFSDAEAESDTRSSRKTAYRGKWREAQYRRSDQKGDPDYDRAQQTPPRPPQRPPQRSKHLATLGLREPVHLLEIKMAYRQMAKVYHPDRYTSAQHSDADRLAAESKMRDVNAAYDWLRANA